MKNFNKKWEFLIYGSMNLDQMHDRIWSAPDDKAYHCQEYLVDFFEKKIIYCQRYGLDNHLAWLKKGKTGGDPKLTELL